jgi:beta-lactamase class D
MIRLEGEDNIGWFIGILEKGDDQYVFVSFLKAPEGKFDNFAKMRVDIAYRCLRDMKLIP